MGPKVSQMNKIIRVHHEGHRIYCVAQWRSSKQSLQSNEVKNKTIIIIQWREF